MTRRNVEPIKVERKYDADWESHPAFGHVHASRVTSNPSVSLFDSEILHSHYVVLSIQTAERKRDLSRDWIHPSSTPLIEVAMSEAQWASLVSSMNAGGTPCTIQHRETQRNVPELPYEPRMAQSIAEVREAYDKSLGRAKAAMAAYDALDAKAPAKERRAALADLRQALNHAESNGIFAAQSLAEHVEGVVTRAKADVEAMVAAHAERLGIEAGDYTGPLVIESGPADAT
jgi:hypothetical protein